MPVVSISDSQRTPLPHIAWQGTVYHGLPAELFEARDTPGDYLAFLGRISPEKRIDRAIEIAKRTGIPLKVAAKIDPVDRGYYEAEIAPLMKHPLVEYLGEIGEKEKNDFLGNAYAMLFPIDWPEPFGLVMIESIACGTPVVAFRNGSVPEIMVDGVSGYIVETVEEAAKAVFDIASLSRAKCREYFEQRFLASRMASDYVKIYRKLAAIKQPSGPLTWKVNGNKPGGSVKSPDRVRVPFNHRKN